ncbi:MAG: hypothetical protein RIQ89_1292 [Bacteroidota bacterium]|jgi:FkbM family methyltransferase
MKNTIKDLLLSLGLYYPINDRRAEHQHRFLNQTKFYQQHISKADLVFDVGANVGQRSTIFSKLANKVIAIEPQPLCQKHLKSRFKFKSNVIIEQVGLDEKPGTATLFESDSHTLSSMSKDYIDTVKQSTFKNNSWNKSYTVKTTTLDLLIQKYGKPKFIKIDVEGFELNVLKGLRHPISMISFEFNPAYIQNTIDCIQYLYNLNNTYRFNYCIGEDLEFACDSNLTADTIIKTATNHIGSGNFFGDVYAILS